MLGKLISVIIPVYKVEQYLDECVKSVVSQTYKNLEIILVDDGSPDNCGNMCDEWAKRDNRIVVVHKENGGLSSARNAGIAVATGEYIGFVDSDDYIAKDAYEKLILGFSKYPNIGIVSGMIKRFRNDDRQPFDYRSDWIIKQERLVPSKRYLEAMILETSSQTVWNKLFLAEIVKKTPFREGRNNEDTLFDYYLSKYIIERKLTLLDIPEYVYFYRVTSDSICHSKTRPLRIDIVANYQEMLQDPTGHSPEQDVVIYDRYTRAVTWLVDSLLKNPEWKRNYLHQYMPLLRKIPNSYILHNWSLKNRILFLEIKYFPFLREIQHRIMNKSK